MLLNFQMILQGHYFGLQDTCLAKKIIKINDFAIFMLLPSLLCVLFNYTILLYFTIFASSHVLFCYQSRTLLSVTYFLLSVTYFFVINTR